jgi:hypothetical protein
LYKSNTTVFALQKEIKEPNTLPLLERFGTMMLKVHRLFFFNFRIPWGGYDEVTFLSIVFRFHEVVESLDLLGDYEMLKKRW